MPIAVSDIDLVKAENILAPTVMALRNQIVTAVVAERERCAHIADHFAQANMRWTGEHMAEVLARLIRDPSQ